LISFNDAQLVTSRIDQAAAIYGLTEVQTHLARLLAQGRDPAAAAEVLDVSINTVRTHIQRMFDKTGARSQSALVGLLLSAEAPTAK
jgi:DNA-binding CsgD family transcriptional regulator